MRLLAFAKPVGMTQQTGIKLKNLSRAESGKKSLSIHVLNNVCFY
jgi:hypothetical protein